MKIIQMCELCETDAAQPDSFLCECCTLRMEVQLEGDRDEAPIQEE